MIETSESIVALTAAILKVQGSIDGVHKNAKNQHFKSSYATLENVIDTARPALQEAGIAFVQAPGMVIDGSVEISTMLVHSSGEWMRSTLHVPLGKRDPQGVGSAITYGCRYSLMAMLGLPPTDDDGEAAMDRESFEPSRPVAGSAPVKSSAQLKRDNFWPEFERELDECDTFIKLERFRKEWWEKSKRDGWNEAFKSAAKDRIEGREKILMNAHDDDTFPGDRPNGAVANMMAG
jgi:hypothetical protein